MDRRAGVLLHPTSLPGPGAFGVLGDEAFAFVDRIAEAGISVWQTLPLGPVGEDLSPYNVNSAHAGGIHLIDPNGLAAEGWLSPAQADPAVGGTAGVRELLAEAFAGFRTHAPPAMRRRFEHFMLREAHWLMPHCLFEARRRRFGCAWWEWPSDARKRPDARAGARWQGDPVLRGIAFEQFVFERQWRALRRHARRRNVLLFGDLPFYVDANSVEVWWDRQLFRIDADGRSQAVAGVPPDYFNADGQRWGNPLYDWERMETEGFDWWLRRLQTQLQRFDLLRIDHFRALQACWEIPGDAPTAREGRWQQVPGRQLLRLAMNRPGGMPLVAEDLGHITEEVRALRREFALPGMLVLQFAFDGHGDNPYLPANHVEQAVVYTGTHDNDTTLGWYRSLDEATRGEVARVLGSDDIPAALIAAACDSPARLAVVPMQDWLALDSGARMNVPGTVGGMNWRWRMASVDYETRMLHRWRERLVAAGRCPR